MGPLVSAVRQDSDSWASLIYAGGSGILQPDLLECQIWGTIGANPQVVDDKSGQPRREGRKGRKGRPAAGRRGPPGGGGGGGAPGGGRGEDPGWESELRAREEEVAAHEERILVREFMQRLAFNTGKARLLTPAQPPAQWPPASRSLCYWQLATSPLAVTAAVYFQNIVSELLSPHQHHIIVGRADMQADFPRDAPWHLGHILSTGPCADPGCMVHSTTGASRSCSRPLVTPVVC